LLNVEFYEVCLYFEKQDDDLSENNQIVGASMFAHPHFGRPLHLCLALTFALASQIHPALAFDDEWRERRMETPIGMEDTREAERAIGFQRDADYRRIETNSIYGSTLSSALGNEINVEAAVGSSVVINANQVNRGSQMAVTVIADDPEDYVKDAVEDFHEQR
jgi:hypothetical protein